MARRHLQCARVPAAPAPSPGTARRRPAPAPPRSRWCTSRRAAGPAGHRLRTRRTRSECLRRRRMTHRPPLPLSSRQQRRQAVYTMPARVRRPAVGHNPPNAPGAVRYPRGVGRSRPIRERRLVDVQAPRPDGRVVREAGGCDVSGQRSGWVGGVRRCRDAERTWPRSGRWLLRRWRWSPVVRRRRVNR